MARIEATIRIEFEGYAPAWEGENFTPCEIGDIIASRHRSHETRILAATVGFSGSPTFISSWKDGKKTMPCGHSESQLEGGMCGSCLRAAHGIY